jgi:hypothetical protein
VLYVCSARCVACDESELCVTCLACDEIEIVLVMRAKSVWLAMRGRSVWLVRRAKSAGLGEACMACEESQVCVACDESDVCKACDESQVYVACEESEVRRRARSAWLVVSLACDGSRCDVCIVLELVPHTLFTPKQRKHTETVTYSSGKVHRRT